MLPAPFALSLSKGLVFLTPFALSLSKGFSRPTSLALNGEVVATRALSPCAVSLPVPRSSKAEGAPGLTDATRPRCRRR